MSYKNNIFPIFKHLFSIVTATLLVAMVAINRDNRIFGISLDSSNADTDTECISYVDDKIVINTTNLITDVKGFRDATPLEIYINADGRIESVIALPNSESPRFFNSLEKRGLYNQWIGLTPQEAINSEINTISGATISSKSVIDTFHKTMEYVVNNNITHKFDITSVLSLKNILVIVVILTTIILPIYVNNKRYRYFQLILNIVVLGLWCKSFLSLSMIINFVSNGLNSVSYIIPLILILTAFILPLFKRKSHYCTWLCPFGSAQEIINIISPFKIKINEKTNRYLTIFRKLLWVVIMLIMWLGIFFEIVDYEPFTIFIFNQASIPVIIIGTLFLFLSLFVKRPYCRYVCPTGTLIKLSEKR